MRNSIESKGKTVEEAVSEALLRLGARRDEVDVTVLQEPTGGFLGLIGGKAAKVRVERKTRGRSGGEGRRGGRDAGRDAGRSGREQRDGRRGGGRGRRSDGDRDRGGARVDPAAGEVIASGRGGGERKKDEDADGGRSRRSRRRGGRGRGRRGRGGAEGESRPDDQQSQQPQQGQQPQQARPAQDRPAQEKPDRRDDQQPRQEAPRRERTETRAETAPETPPAPPKPKPERAAAEPTVVSVKERVQPYGKPDPDALPAFLQTVTADLMRNAGFPCRIEVQEGEYHLVKLVTDDRSAAVLIGRHGASVDAVEHLIDKVAQHAAGDRIPMNLDINNYRRRREEQVLERARNAVMEVRNTGEMVHLESMCARERRVVHLYVAEQSGMATTTEADEEGKHVVVMREDQRPPESAPENVGADADDGRDDEAGEETRSQGSESGAAD